MTINNRNISTIAKELLLSINKYNFLNFRLMSTGGRKQATFRCTREKGRILQPAEERVCLAARWKMVTSHDSQKKDNILKRF